MINLDPIKPYLGLLKLGIGVALLCFVFVKGCTHGEQRTADQVAAKDKVIAQKNEALRDASDALRGAGAALRKVNDEAAQRIAEADRQAKAAAEAEAIAAAALKRMQKRVADFDRQLEQARKNPDCDALMSADARLICGI